MLLIYAKAMLTTLVWREKLWTASETFLYFFLAFPMFHAIQLVFPLKLIEIIELINIDKFLLKEQKRKYVLLFKRVWRLSFRFARTSSAPLVFNQVWI